MSKLSKELHIRAFLTHFELACEWAILIVASDLVWMAHDIVQNGMNAYYFITTSGLSVGLVGTISVLYQHHKHYTHSKLHARINKRVK